MDRNKYTICMKYVLDEYNIVEVKSLEDICYKKQKTNLKLELDLKKRQRQKAIKNEVMLEFLYYENKILLGYLGICNFGDDIVEISGMVHPSFRRRGIFSKLYLIAKEEWQKKSPPEVLALCDHTSISGLAFINSISAEYAFSEYKMCLNKKHFVCNVIQTHENASSIKLRLATREDANEINSQTSVYFGKLQNGIENIEVKTNDIEEVDIENYLIQQGNNFISYMALLEDEIIGKIHISIINKEGFIYGFGVLPNFRGMGYGRKVLISALDILKEKKANIIFLEVETQNKNAINLYESCGFEQVSVMDYYIIN